MAEEEQNASNETAKAIARIEKIFLKDVSFETPNSPSIFTMEWKPATEFELAHTARKIDDDVYEVVLVITATTKIDDKTAYLAEVHQSGIFTLKVSDEQQLEQATSVFCSRTLYPYACAAMADLVTKGGFPQLLLAPINFDALYQKKLQESGEAAEA